MCQALRTERVSPPRKRFIRPRWSSCSSSCRSSKEPRRMARKTRTIPTRTARLRMPRIQRNTPETEAPTTPVAESSVESSSWTCPASAFTPSDSRSASTNTIVEWPRENQKPTESGRRGAHRERPAGRRRADPVGEQLAGRVVDGGDVVGVEGVPQAEGVGEHPHADVEDAAGTQAEVPGDDEAEQHPEADDVQQHDDPEHPGQRRPVAPAQRAAEARQAGRGPHVGADRHAHHKASAAVEDDGPPEPSPGPETVAN